MHFLILVPGNQFVCREPQFTNLKFSKKETTGKPVAKKEGKYIDSNTR